jgi:hypothetical protein
MSNFIDDMNKIEEIIGIEESKLGHALFDNTIYQIFETEKVTFCVMEKSCFDTFDRHTNKIIGEYQDRIKKLEQENYILGQKAEKYDAIKTVFKDLIE